VAAGVVILFHVPPLDPFGLSPSTVGLSDFSLEGAGELVGVVDGLALALGTTEGDEEGVADTVGTFDGWVLGILLGASEGEFEGWFEMVGALVVGAEEGTKLVVGVEEGAKLGVSLEISVGAMDEVGAVVVPVLGGLDGAGIGLGCGAVVGPTWARPATRKLQIPGLVSVNSSMVTPVLRIIPH
jgi:hypothetical protein